MLIEDYQEIRDAVRALCAEFPAEYHRHVDERRGYPRSSWTPSHVQDGWLH
jgi:acyl-CoA dehydrogenase